MESKKNSSKLIGVFGRINYNWKDLIMASVSYRMKALPSSALINKWGSFVAGSLAWEIANMPFMQGATMVDC